MERNYELVMSYPVPGALQCWRKRREGFEVTGKEKDRLERRVIQTEWRQTEYFIRAAFITRSCVYCPLCLHLSFFHLLFPSFFFFSLFLIFHLPASLRSSFSSTSGLLSLSSVLYFLHFFIFIYVITLMWEELHRSFGTKWGDNETRVVFPPPNSPLEAKQQSLTYIMWPNFALSEPTHLFIGVLLMLVKTEQS